QRADQDLEQLGIDIDHVFGAGGGWHDGLLTQWRAASPPEGRSSTAISTSAVITRPRSVRSAASSSACFSFGAKGQIMASEVTSRSSEVPSIADQSAVMACRLKKSLSAARRRGRSINAWLVPSRSSL